jgi:hypothetical protein
VGDTFCFGDAGSFLIGVIFGNGNPLGAKAPPDDDVDVLLPQLELRLPLVHCASSSPRTVNNRVNNNALVAPSDIGIKCIFVVIPLYDNGIAPYMYSVIASKSRSA